MPMFEEHIKGKRLDEPLFTSKFQNRLDRFSAYRIIKEACGCRYKRELFMPFAKKNFWLSSLSKIQRRSYASKNI